MPRFNANNLRRDIVLLQGVGLPPHTPGHCWHCGAETFAADIDFEAYICSTECHDAKIAEWREAMRKAGPLYGPEQETKEATHAASSAQINAP